MKKIAALVLAASSLFAARTASAHCPDADTLVVGDTCKRFGEDSSGWLPDWSSELPPIALTLSLRSLAYVPSSRESFDGNVEASPLAYRFGGDKLGSSALRAYGAELGAEWYPKSFFYVGLAVAMGEGKLSTTSIATDALSIEPRDSLNLSLTTFGPHAGLRLPLGPVSIRGEVYVGAEWISLDQYASNGASRLTASSSATTLLVEPRATVDLWLTPFVAVSAFASMPEFDPRGTNAGLVISGHFRAFDGAYSIF